MILPSEVTAAYVRAALWSSSDNRNEAGGEPFDASYAPDDIAPETRETMSRDCVEFLKENRAVIERCGLDAGQVGHDFWLTRNGHGAGFWDRGLGKAGDELTAAADRFGTFDLYLGDDGQIHGA